MTQEQKLTCPRALRSTSVFLTTCLVLFAALNLQAAPKATISVIADGQMGAGARHGLSKVRLALEEKGIQAQTAVSLEEAQGDSLLVLGLSSGSGPAAMLLDSLGVSKPTKAESLLVRHTKSAGRQARRPSGGQALLVSGTDDRGLMYALLDIADRTGWGAIRPKEKSTAGHPGGRRGTRDEGRGTHRPSLLNKAGTASPQRASCRSAIRATSRAKSR